MAIRARVELMGSLSYNFRGREWEQGKPAILTNAAEIDAYRRKAEFKVTVLQDPKPAAAKPAPGKKVAKPAPVVEEPDEDEDSDDEDEEPDEDGDADEETDDQADDEDEQEAKPVYKKAELEKQEKGSLMELAKSDFGLTLPATMSKPKMIGEILKAQIAAQKGA
jgi:type IV secretory pathway VirB10-like protein